MTDAAEAIFLALADVDPADRDAWLTARCGADARLRRDVEALMAALHVPDEDFLDPERIPTLDMAAVDGPLQPGTSLGGFLVLHALGSGGMGVVYAAQQDRPRRTVAIKVLRRGYRHPEILRRFEHEAEMLGRLQHPGIAQVYAFHPGDRAIPAHLVMELVAGPPLTDYARAQQLPTAARVRLMIKLVDAVEHAHGRGIIHRDLKPANVLVAEGGQPKILDFGIARAIGRDVQRITIQTAQGQLMGTLAYMSPEQLRGQSADIDGRSDVYALGVLLYRLLTERSPFDTGELTWPEALRHVLESDPVPAGDINAALRGPLEHIIARAMARDVLGRYQTAAELAADLQRFLEGRPPATGSLAAAGRGGSPPAIDPAGYEPWPVAVHGVRALAASADGRFVAIGFASGSIELRDADAGGVLASFSGHQSSVTAVTFAADGRVIAAWEDGRVAMIALQAAPS